MKEKLSVLKILYILLFFGPKSTISPDKYKQKYGVFDVLSFYGLIYSVNLFFFVSHLTSLDKERLRADKQIRKLVFAFGHPLSPSSSTKGGYRTFK